MEEVGMCKPDPRIFPLAADMLDGFHETATMVGDLAKTDIKGALDVGLRPILYAPRASVAQQFLCETTVPVIAHMTQLLDMLETEGKIYDWEEH
jgi:FMN phosphatase YigB (HAD superfamily)